MKIYVASSWRNQFHQEVVRVLRENGFDVYDFKNPKPGNNGFSWVEIDPHWLSWSSQQFRQALSHPVAESGFLLDINALMECDVCILVLPCGRSAHLEAGFTIGTGKPTVILLSGQDEPELMYKMTPFICIDLDEMLQCLHGIKKSVENGTCRVCGCTDECACEGGCYWVEPGLCSNCAGNEVSKDG